MDLEQLSGRFALRYGEQPTLIVRAPGRVNLIGEHTDYNDLPVLPMAIEREIAIAAAPLHRAAPAQLELASVLPDFGAARFALTAPIESAARGDWSNYVRATAQELLSTGPLTGARLLVDGDIPPGAGLSSSSALVVAAGLTLAVLAEREIDRATLAETLAAAERRVGTQSGGMDQAVSLLGVREHALRIDFDPLATRALPLAPDHVFVVSHSLVVAEKSAGARDAYNTRVGECRLATAALELALGDAASPLPRFGALRERFPDRALESHLEALAGLLPAGEVALEPLARQLGVSTASLAARLPETVRERALWAPLPRARHVLREGARVDAAETALVAQDMQAFGRLMNTSHESCRDDYAISCPALEDLVAAARHGGALGARLTGAGFGGCIVSLVPCETEGALLERLDQDFYRPRGQRAADHCWTFSACAGASWQRV